MEAAHHESGLADRTTPLYVVPGVESRVKDELAAQLDTALAFADFCTFLTSGRVSDQADKLIRMAQILYAETTEDLTRSRPRG
jgi:hypothetical protein